MTTASFLPWFQRVPRPMVIAHRGASMYAPENTLAAFKLAIAQGADAIELDVDQCAGGDLVVIHDATVDRTTSEPGKVADLSLREIKELDAGSWFDVEFRGEQIPTLDEVFETVGRKIRINIELKNYTRLFDDLAVKVAHAVRAHHLEDWVFISSFNPFNFRKFKRLLPDVPVGLLTFPRYARPGLVGLVRRLAPFDALHPHVSDATPACIDRSHRAGMPVFAYTINEPDPMRRVLDAGIDGVITDDPRLAREILSQAVRT